MHVLIYGFHWRNIGFRHLKLTELDHTHNAISFVIVNGKLIITTEEPIVVRNCPGDLGKCAIPELSWRIEEMHCSGIILEN